MTKIMMMIYLKQIIKLINQIFIFNKSKKPNNQNMSNKQIYKKFNSIIYNNSSNLKKFNQIKMQYCKIINNINSKINSNKAIFNIYKMNKYKMNKYEINRIYK